MKCLRELKCPDKAVFLYNVTVLGADGDWTVSVLGAAVPAEVYLCFRWLIHGSVCLIIVSIAVKSLTSRWSLLLVHCGFA